MMITLRIGALRRTSPGSAAPCGRRNKHLAVSALFVLLFFAASISPAAALEGRWTDIEGTSRFRDMGGYPAGGSTVRTGVLFRSDDLSKITVGGVDELINLGIVTVVDLRSDARDSSRIEELSGGTITVMKLPMVADPIKDKNDYYKRMIVNSRQSLIGLLIVLADREKLPMVMFDEDGINEVDVAGQFILLSLGVPGPDVISDYLLTNERGAALKPQWGEIIMRYFEEYGGMDYYATRILGLSGDQLDRVRENLITH